MKFMSLLKRWRMRAIAACALSFFLMACVVPPQQSWALSLSDEKTLGRKLLERIREQMPLIEDGEVVTYVQSVGNRITKHVGTSVYQYQFFVVDEPIPNAFAIPGGYIFVYRGLIELLSTEGELASILSHELAHIQARHIHRRLEQGKWLSIAAIVGALAGAFIGMQGGGNASQAVAAGAIAGTQSLALKYSRENEEEADQLGFRYMVEAGYDPRNMVNAMQKLNRSQWRGNSNVPSYLSTHPALSERAQYLQTMIEKQAPSPKPRREKDLDSGDFPFMRAVLLSDFGDSKMALSHFQAEEKRGSLAGVYGLGRLYLRQGNGAQALPYLQEVARHRSDSPFVLSTLGLAYFQQGQLDEARRVLQSALLLDPNASSAHLRLALVLKDLGQKSEALAHLRQIEEFAPSFPEIDYQMGVLLGQLNQLGLAHFHLGRYHQHKQDWRNSEYHYEKAKALLKDSPQKVAEVNQALKEVVQKRKEAARRAFQ